MGITSLWMLSMYLLSSFPFNRKVKYLPQDVQQVNGQPGLCTQESRLLQSTLCCIWRIAEDNTFPPSWLLHIPSLWGSRLYPGFHMWEQAQGVQQENVVSSVEKISFLLYKILKSWELTLHIQEEKKGRFLLYIQGTVLALMCGRSQSDQWT